MSRRMLPLAALLLGVTPLAAQTSAPPPHLSVVDGRVELTRGTEREQALANTPLVLGDQLRTEDGRAEVLLGDGSALHLDWQTTVDVNGDALARLVTGRLIVLAERGADGGLQIDTAPASVRVQSSAEVHLALVEGRGRPALQVAVVRGWVDVDSGAGAVPVRAGQQVLVEEGEAPYPSSFNSARFDDFTRWSMALLDSRRGTSSAQYLPADVRQYGATFDQYGSWSYAAPYGYVWYPRVAVGWRPYHHGRWRHSGRYGWTFVGYDPWGWATHHYGRWGLSSAGAWFWIPSAGWGAAWVHWAVSPGYIGWCPLGWNNRPVLAFWGHGSRSGYYGRYGHGYRDPWRAWSVVSVHSFRGGDPIHRQRFDPAPFTGPRAPAFVVQPTPPNVAIPRGAVVAPGYRVAGPSVAPRAGQSRRGPPTAASASPVVAVPRFGTPSASRGATSAAPRGAASAPAATSPPVIYHRGRPSEPASGASAYERAGVAVPRGLPADRNPETNDRADQDVDRAPSRYRTAPSASPYGGSTSPYARPRGEAPAGAMPSPRSSRSGDHPDYAAPRSPEYRAPESRAPQPRGPEQRAPSYRAPEQRSDPPRARGGDGGGSHAAPRGGHEAPRTSAPPRHEGSSRGGSSASPRSSGGRSSSGTAVPRRR